MAITERVCAICNKEIEEGVAPVVCVRCHTLYHQKCWQGVERCVVYGCNEPKEAYGLVNAEQSEVECPDCHEKNPSSAQLCLHCGKALGAEVKRKVFVSNAKWRATTDQEIIEGLSSHWDSGIRHLYGGDVEHWFASHGHPDWAAKAAEIRRTCKQRSVGLETFLGFTGLVETPKLTLTPPRLILESSSSLVETVIDITNGGRGYLFGTIKADVPWIKLSEEEFFGNRNRIEITVNMEEIPNGEATAHLCVEGNGGQEKVEIKATRIGVENALFAFESGDIAKARVLCRRLIDTQMVSADVALVLAACCITEGNTGGVASALSKVTGGCVHVGDTIISMVYDWLQNEGQKMAGLDHLAILECMVPLAEGDLETKIKAAMARLALERVEAFRSSAGTGTSLWQDNVSASKSVNELLAMAVELDPSVAMEAHNMRKQYSGTVRKSSIQKALWYLVLLLVLGGVGYGMWAVSSNSEDREFRPVKEALSLKNYNEAIRQVRILCDNNPEETRYFKYYLDVVFARAQDEIAAKKWDAVRNSIDRMASITSEHFALSGTAAGLVCKLADSAEKAGCATEARVYYEMAAEFDANNTEANINRARLASSTDLFWKVYLVANGELGRSVCDDCAHNESLQSGIDTLESLGLQAYSGQMQLVFCDMNGDGQRELVVCGNDSKPSIAKGKSRDRGLSRPEYGRGHCDIYELKDGRLVRSFKDESIYNHLITAQSGDLSGTGRSDVAVCWGGDSAGLTRKAKVYACKDGKFVGEEVPGSGFVDYADYDEDGRVEVWVASSPSGGAYKNGVAVYSPFIWTEPGFVKATGNYDVYYKRCIEDWQREIKEYQQAKSGGSDPYIREREQAIATVARRLQSSKSGDK